MAAEDALVNSERPVGHALDRELSDTGAGRGGEPCGEHAILEERCDAHAEDGGIADGGEQTGDAVVDDVGDPSGARRRDWFPDEERVEQDGPHPLLARAQRDDVGRGEERVGVRSITGEVQTIAEPLLADSVLHLLAQRTVADQERVQTGNPLHRRRHGANEGQRILMSDELRHLHERLRRGWPDLAMDICAVRNDGDTRAVDSIRDKDLGDGTRDGDNRVRTAVLPSRADVAPEMKVDPTGHDERGAHTEREGGECPERDGVRGVSVHDVDPFAFDEGAQSEHGPRIGFERRRARDHGETGSPGALGEGLARSCGDERSMSATCQLGGEPEHLALTATPTALGIDVEDAQGKRAADCNSGLRTATPDCGRRMLQVSFCVACPSTAFCSSASTTSATSCSRRPSRRRCASVFRTPRSTSGPNNTPPTSPASCLAYGR